MIHVAKIDNRKVTVFLPWFVQGGINSDEIVLKADSEWVGCDTILCTFTNENTGKAVSYLCSQETNLYVPKSMLEVVGALQISFTGYKGGKVRLTTEKMGCENMCRVIPSGVIAGEGEDSHPDDLDYLGQLIQQVEDIFKQVEGGILDYLALDNKPSIEGVELVGDKTFAQLGATPMDDADINEATSD